MQQQILLYYKYVHLENPETVKNWQLVLCKKLNLVGRIIIATEGINGTLSGSVEATNQYVEAMQHDERFADIDFKKTVVDGNDEYFPKLRVVIKNEIVHLGLDKEQFSVAHGAQHLTPAQTHALLEKNPDDLVILDGRNLYEARVGKFTNAIVPPIDYARNFADYIDENAELFRDKEVLMYCTGGVRCERKSAYLSAKNVAKKVYQIEGGIHRYVEQFPNGFFRGKNYVFDGRVTVPVNDDILSTCDLCPTACDEYTNCQNARCNNQFIACKPCLEKYTNCCSPTCHELLSQGKVPARPMRPRARV